MHLGSFGPSIADHASKAIPSSHCMCARVLLYTTRLCIEVCMRGAQCLLTLARSPKPPHGSVPSACVLLCSLYITRL